jgi:alpha-beta hydrolase superfamily lysophospholipase
VGCVSEDATLCAAAMASYGVAPTWVAGGDVRAVVSCSAWSVVVAFPGTRPAVWQDWRRDFDAIPVEDEDLGWCHGGFLSGALAILPQLWAAFAGGRPYRLTGHSMGGALAIAVGAKMAALGLPPACLTTFGAPRVGMVRLAAVLAAVPGSRLRNGADPVPLAPTWPWISDRPRRQIGVPGPNPLADHAIDRYREALMAA